MVNYIMYLYICICYAIIKISNVIKSYLILYSKYQYCAQDTFTHVYFKNVTSVLLSLLCKSLILIQSRFKEGQLISVSNGEAQSSLELSKMQLSDSGNYVCRASNDFSSISSSVASIRVKCKLILDLLSLLSVLS